MRVVFIGCVEFSLKAIEHILGHTSVTVCGIVTRRQSSVNADFTSLEHLAQQAGIPCFIPSGNQQEKMASWIEELKPDVVFCFGWSYLLKREILQIPRLGVIGYHPAALPCNRGRHPIIWALALGLERTASTFFFMDDGADSGDILNQEFLDIYPEDNARSLYYRLTDTALNQIEVFVPRLANGSFQRTAQQHELATYWRKRSERDGIIDWRMSALSIHNLVRALTRPYPGAEFIREERHIKVWKSELADIRHDISNIEPGKVLEAADGSLTVKCGEGALRILEHDLNQLPEPGDYL
jgi:methionyl-tRNA formyltransferase